MDSLERNRSVLKKYIPEPTVNIIADWIYQYNFKLKVKRARSSKEGDYTPPHSGKNHVITINRDLNQYAFLVTLVHEIAHLVTWEKHKGKVMPHGREWKSEYVKLLGVFVNGSSALDRVEGADVFPHDLHSALHKHMHRPSAASCSDLHLSRVLHKFDANTEALLLERIAAGSSFRIASSRTKHSNDVFIKGEKKRTRFKCIHTPTRREYLIHALCKVVLGPPNPPKGRA